VRELAGAPIREALSARYYISAQAAPGGQRLNYTK
jgi:hypothetical protein